MSESLKFENIEKTYNGKSHTCMCGCAGSYSDGGTRESKLRYNKVLKSKEKQIQLGLDNQVIVYIENDTRITALYFK
jgi:hypothetical protein